MLAYRRPGIGEHRPRAGSTARAMLFGTAGVLLAALLPGCASLSEDMAARATIAPGKYSVYTCKDLEDRTRVVRNRELELEQLMARSAQGAGGQVVNAIAYQSEYLQARGEIKLLAQAAAEKQCSTQSKWSSERSVF
jgi:hypothetical protein